MRKYISFFSLLLLLAVISCEKSDPVIDKGTLESATYNADTQTFTIIYVSGFSEEVNAVINLSVTPPTASAVLENGTVVSVDNANVSGDATATTPDELSNYRYVNDWIHEEMSIYYLWNDKLPRSPDYSLRPNIFFSSILNTYHSASNPDGDRFSWIQEDYTELLDNLSGVSSDEIGFEYIFAWADKQKSHYYALVLYPRTGTDAEAKGINRGRFITKINGQNITPQNYRDLFGGTGTKRLSMADWTYDAVDKQYFLDNSGEVTIQMHNRYAENPVYMDSVYTYENSKVGYLVYNFFGRDRGNNSNEYDKLLMDRLSEMQSQGIDEMVIDLRYNGGGAVSSAIALASALVKDRSTDNILVTSQYNTIVHNSLSREFGADYNKDYFIDRVQGTTVSIPALNLPRLYVLTSGWTASASEFLINGLKPYMEVILIGETTYGKNVGSISIYEDDDPKNKWGMQPIVVKYANSLGHSDFTAGFVPNYKIDEFEDLYLYEFGDTEDPLLGKAIDLITGGTLATRTSTRIHTSLRSSSVDEKAALKQERQHRFEMYDDVRGEDIRKIMSK